MLNPMVRAACAPALSATTITADRREAIRHVGTRAWAAGPPAGLTEAAAATAAASRGDHVNEYGDTPNAANEAEYRQFSLDRIPRNSRALHSLDGILVRRCHGPATGSEDIFLPRGGEHGTVRGSAEQRQKGIARCTWAG